MAASPTDRSSERFRAISRANIATTPEWQLLTADLQEAIHVVSAVLPFRTNAYIFDQMSAIHAFFPQLLMAFHRVDGAADMSAYINRIRESGRALRQLIDVSRGNATEGVRPTRCWPRLGRR